MILGMIFFFFFSPKRMIKNHPWIHPFRVLNPYAFSNYHTCTKFIQKIVADGLSKIRKQEKICGPD